MHPDLKLDKWRTTYNSITGIINSRIIFTDGQGVLLGPQPTQPVTVGENIEMDFPFGANDQLMGLWGY